VCIATESRHALNDCSTPYSHLLNGIWDKLIQVLKSLPQKVKVVLKNIKVLYESLLHLSLIREMINFFLTWLIRCRIEVFLHYEFVWWFVSLPPYWDDSSLTDKDVALYVSSVTVGLVKKIWYIVNIRDLWCICWWTVFWRRRIRQSCVFVWYIFITHSRYCVYFCVEWSDCCLSACVEWSDCCLSAFLWACFLGSMYCK
jgi:hypothetical protein